MLAPHPPSSRTPTSGPSAATHRSRNCTSCACFSGAKSRSMRTQRVPVQIALDGDQGHTLYPGTSARVTIHIHD